MAVEIERKFLIRDDSWKKDIRASHELSQGYLLTAAPCTMRIRVQDSIGFLTIKGPTSGLSRDEFEYEIPVEDAREMLAKFCGDRIIEKVRYLVDYAGKVWEIDVFSGPNAGLQIAEVELSEADENIELPPWVGDEVSGQLRYYNSHLIKFPYSEWD